MSIENKRRSFFDHVIGSVFQKLIVTGVEHDQVWLIIEYLFNDRRQAIAGIRNTAAIDDVVLPGLVGRPKAQLKPGRERSFDRIRTTLNRRSANTKNPELISRFVGRKRIVAEQWLPRFRDFVGSAVLIEFKQWPRAGKSNERIFDTPQRSPANHTQEQL